MIIEHAEVIQYSLLSYVTCTIEGMMTLQLKKFLSPNRSDIYMIFIGQAFRSQILLSKVKYASLIDRKLKA